MRKGLLISLLFIYNNVTAQLPESIRDFYTGHSLFYIPAEHDSSKPFLIAVVPKSIKKPIYLINGKFIPDSSERKKLFTISNDSSYLKHRVYRQPFICYDSSEVRFFAQGINKQNANQYEYQATSSNGRVISPWTTPNEFLKGTYVSGYGDGDPEMAHIGPFKSEWDNFVRIEIREKESSKITCRSIVFWISEKPEVLATFNGQQLNEFFKFFDYSSRNEATMNMWTEGNELKSLVKEKTFFTNQNGIIFLLKDLVYKKIIEYRIIGDENNKDWKLNEYDFNFIWLKQLNPGKYKLQLRYSMQKENISEYEFEILPAWYQTTTFKIITGSIVAAILGLILILFRQRSQKNKLNRQLEQKEKKELELRSIRSQLNPHFVFNALNSIQGLVNANEKEKANQYLSDFSNMMRDTLSGNSKDYSPLETELAILDRYLKLEQLRFGFVYEIKVADNINTSSIEIPTLLLQPLVENAVKHGAAQLLGKGKIAIEINKSGKDLIVAIKDNGPGFIEAQENKKGYGIRLTRERIQLINQINKEIPISLSFKKTTESMTAEVIFKDLF